MRRFDVVVVGGGIHGVGVAQAVAAAGHSVLLIEKRALAAGTSSKSSKLIHGGLRYLESGQFRLVRESLAERRIMLAIAPDLVRLVPFHMPVYRETRRRPWQLRLGLSIYALLGGFQRELRFGSVPRREWSNLDGLVTRDLVAVLRYFDAQTDDAALTRAVMRSAQTLGAELALPAELYAAELRDDAVIVRYLHAGSPQETAASVLINAAGPWASEVAHRISPAVPVPRVELVQGSHIVVPGEPSRGIYYVESPRDGRAVFVMPWHGHTLVGTTETRFRGDPDQVHPLAAERHYLVSVLSHYFAQYAKLDAHQLIDSFAGLRVLPAGAGHAFHRSRETLLVTDRPARPRALSIYGGKLTGWRATAEHVCREIAAALPARAARADTRTLKLPSPG
ncbi:MAG TPA: FAD-dependent oxidoreductase [Steroidobacteraceae bacterium]|nr:FAD-dependent oxidoreductase [Steroidobacteraceae bacterium]